jgi:type I restriction-modification system DNA methylase subunit
MTVDQLMPKQVQRGLDFPEPVEVHAQQNPASEFSIRGGERTDEAGRLCRLNLAVHGLEGDIRHGGQVNSYYDDPHNATGRFDFVLANPPFNVNAVDTAMRVDARRQCTTRPQGHS